MTCQALLALAQCGSTSIPPQIFFANSKKTNPQTKRASTPGNMPKEAKKRGRRAEKKRKEEAEKGQPKTTPQVLAPPEDPGHFYSGNYGGEAGGEEDTQFYGLLNEEESEYFRKADEILELNQFGDKDGAAQFFAQLGVSATTNARNGFTPERALFIENVWKEANGKELKIANSQGCSRLLEKLILMSSPSQLKSLWQKFTGQ